MKDVDMVSNNKTKLVEYHDENGPHRVILPVESNNVELGIPYGVPFEDIAFPVITPARVARTLREHGIWTAEDVRGNVKTARAAVTALTNELFTALLLAVREV